MHLDLHKVIYSRKTILESHIQAFTFQILRGLGYLHSAGIVHRNLKPENVLVNRDCSLRIADLGLARGRSCEDEELTDYVVTRWYRSPELMLYPSGYDESIDLWSVGCITAELVGRQPLFPGDSHVDMLRRIANVLGFSIERDLSWLPPEGKLHDGVLRFMRALNLPERPEEPLERVLPLASETCLCFVQNLLARDPGSRPSADAALRDPYLAHLAAQPDGTTPPRQFSWEFDRYDPTSENVKDRVYAECVRMHPEIAARDAGHVSELPKASSSTDAVATAVAEAAAAGAVAAAPVAAAPAATPAPAPTTTPTPVAAAATATATSTSSVASAPGAPSTAGPPKRAPVARMSTPKKQQDEAPLRDASRFSTPRTLPQGEAPRFSTPRKYQPAETPRASLPSKCQPDETPRASLPSRMSTPRSTPDDGPPSRLVMSTPRVAPDRAPPLRPVTARPSEPMKKMPMTSAPPARPPTRHSAPARTDQALGQPPVARPSDVEPAMEPAEKPKCPPPMRRPRAVGARLAGVAGA